MAARAVFDCMLFLQGAARPSGPAAACLELATTGRVELLLSPDILAELRDVLTRPKIQKKFPSLTHERIDAFLTALLQTATLATTIPATVRLPRDPKDEKYLNLAVYARATWLVSRDKDILDLADPLSFEGNALRQLCPGLLIADPESFLRALAAESKTQPETQPQDEPQDKVEPADTPTNP